MMNMLDFELFYNHRNSSNNPEVPMKSVLLFDGVFQYGVVSEFLNEMVTTLPKFNLKPIRVNLTTNEIQKLETVDFDSIACAICFNGIHRLL